MADKVAMAEIDPGTLSKDLRQALLTVIFQNMLEMLGQCAICKQEELLLDVGDGGAKICRDCAYARPEQTRANMIISLEKANIPAEARAEIIARMDKSMAEFQKEQQEAKTALPPKFSPEELRSMN